MVLKRSAAGTGILAAAAMFAGAQQAAAQPVSPEAISAGATDTPPNSSEVPWASTELGDYKGFRSWLNRRGVTVGLIDTEELLANVNGGVKRGATTDGLSMFSVGLDTNRAFGLRGGTVNVSVLSIRGRSLSADNLAGNTYGLLDPISGNEAEPSTRLWEAWFDEASPSGNFDVKLGLQSLDQEFLTGTYTGLFIDASAGWPAAPSADFYGGSPVYPLSSVGVRVRGTVGPFTALAGVFDDNPPGGSFLADDQRRGAERTGTLFSVSTGALIIAELQYKLPGKLTGIYRVGGMYDTGLFGDARFDENGLSLADPASDGRPAQHHGNDTIYASVDQALWQDKLGRTLGVFARIEAAPPRQNLVTMSANAGLSLSGPIGDRPNDTLGVEWGIARISSQAAGLDRDRAALSGTPGGMIRSSENFVELTYQIQVTPAWNIQPAMQYVFTPGGGFPNPADMSANPHRIGNETVFNLRTTLSF